MVLLWRWPQEIFYLGAAAVALGRFAYVECKCSYTYKMYLLWYNLVPFDCSILKLNYSLIRQYLRLMSTAQSICRIINIMDNQRYLIKGKCDNNCRKTKNGSNTNLFPHANMQKEDEFMCINMQQIITFQISLVGHQCQCRQPDFRNPASIDRYISRE